MVPHGNVSPFPRSWITAALTPQHRPYRETDCANGDFRCHKGWEEVADYALNWATEAAEHGCKRTAVGV